MEFVVQQSHFYENGEFVVILVKLELVKLQIELKQEQQLVNKMELTK
jgi:hypothetical protein